MIGIMGALIVTIYCLLLDHSRVDPGARKAEPLPNQIDQQLCCTADVPKQIEVREAVDYDGRDILRGRIPFRRSGTEDVRWAKFDFYQAHGKPEDPRPAIVISPITGGGYELSRWLANDLITHGYHAVIVKRPDDVKALRARADLDAFETEMRNAVVARRRVIDWLQSRPEVDPKKIGAYGVSLGGVVTAVLAAVEPRIVASVVVMGSGELPALICRSVEREPRRLARAHGVPENPTPSDISAFEKHARPILQTDPQLLAKYADPREVLMVIARRDTSVPSDLQERLRDALGGPETLSLPTGHFSSAMYLPVVTSRARRFLASRFGSR